MAAAADDLPGGGAVADGGRNVRMLQADKIQRRVLQEVNEMLDEQFAQRRFFEAPEWHETGGKKRTEREKKQQQEDNARLVALRDAQDGLVSRMTRDLSDDEFKLLRGCQEGPD